MNFFRVHSVGLLGLHGIPVEVECMQSRRLPYLQIIGASAAANSEIRERVMAAMESAGCRLPARRITVRFQPGIHGFSLENLDLAMALAVLAASGKIPANRLENLLICGSLGLDGRIQAAGAEYAAQKIFARGNFRGAILPFDESAWLPAETLGFGGGFESLAEVISFLTSRKAGIRSKIGPAIAKDSPKTWHCSQSSARLIEIAAAGGHHALILAPSSLLVSDFAGKLAQILPANQPELACERELLARLRGNRSLAKEDYLEIPASGGSTGAKSSLDPAEELLLAKNGVIYVNKLAMAAPKQVAPLFAWMESGKTEWSKLGHRFSERFDANVVASSPTCECGGRIYGKCSCRPLDLQKYRQRLERAVAGPFDLRYCMPDQPEKQEVAAAEIKARVEAARALAVSRQGRCNGKLSPEEAIAVKPWAPKARQLLRAMSTEESLTAKARAGLVKSALTVSDLRGSAEVNEQDLLEARHYSGFA